MSRENFSSFIANTICLWIAVLGVGFISRHAGHHFNPLSEHWLAFALTAVANGLWDVYSPFGKPRPSTMFGWLWQIKGRADGLQFFLHHLVDFASLVPLALILSN